MKFTILFIGLSFFTSAAMADIATLSPKGTSVNLAGNGATKEIFKILADAYSQGFTDARGAKVFEQLSTPHRVGGRTDYVNKVLSASVQSGITLSYSATLSGKKGEIKLSKKVLTVSGKAAELLKGAMTYTTLIDESGRVGISLTTTPSEKISCSRVVYPHAPTTCTIKL